MMTSNIGDVLKPGKLIEMGKAKVSTGGAVANTGLGMKYFFDCETENQCIVERSLYEPIK